MQLSVAQKLTQLPQFRRRGGNSGYVEGWLLYAEQLGKDVGFYQDPIGDYGRLTSEPAQALSYKRGQLKFLELRDRPASRPETDSTSRPFTMRC